VHDLEYSGEKMGGFLKQSNLFKKFFMLLPGLFIVLASSAYADVTGHVTVNWVCRWVIDFPNFADALCPSSTEYYGEVCIEDTSIFGPFDNILTEYSRDDHGIEPPPPSQDSLTLKSGNKWCSDLNNKIWDSAAPADTLANAKITVRNSSNGTIFQDNTWSVNVSNVFNDTNHTFLGGAPQPKLPTVNINSPLNNSNITSQDFNLTFSINNWVVGGKSSTHIHLHISNQSGLSFSDQLMFYSAPNNVVELNLIPGPTKFATWMAPDTVRFNNLSYGEHTLRAVLADEFHFPQSNPEADQFINIFVDTCVDNDGDGFDGFDANSCPVGNDCDDNNNAVHPGASDAVCDGIDNNCNLQIDEDYVVTPTNCGVGVCAAAGELQCVSGSETDTCTQGTPTTEVCDSLDNNCDGSVDEGGNALCDDGLFCNGAEVCSGVNGCQAGTPPSTSDGVTCTVDSCDETTDTIVHTPTDSICNDGAFCNGQETCDATLDCQAGTAPVVSDNISCTVDSCDEGTDTVLHTTDDSLCDNGLYCDGAETCDATLGCLDQADPCGADQTCDEVTDVCEDIPGFCNNDLDCDDGLFCNGAETCVNNACQIGTTVDCSANNIPEINICNK